MLFVLIEDVNILQVRKLAIILDSASSFYIRLLSYKVSTLVPPLLSPCLRCLIWPLSSQQCPARPGHCRPLIACVTRPPHLCNNLRLSARLSFLSALSHTHPQTPPSLCSSDTELLGISQTLQTTLHLFTSQHVFLHYHTYFLLLNFKPS